MTDFIIVLVLVAVMASAVAAIVKKKRSKASCCGSGSYVAKSRRLKKITEKRIYRVGGMHCQHCVNRVMENIQDIPHTSASVNLKKGLVTVSLETPVAEETLRAAIEKGGYEFLGQVE